MHLILNTLLAFIILSCGGDPSSKSSGIKKMPPTQLDTFTQQDSIDGQYLAKLLPMNSHLTGPLDGAVTLSLDGDEFIGDTRFFGNPLTAEIILEQTVHIGNRCPTLADDLNQDGVIDEREANEVIKEILFPLDGDLNSQWLGANSYPFSDSFGSYYYSQMASFEKMLDDLWEIDINLDDQLIKLEKNEMPELEGKVALIKGVNKALVLPDTIAHHNKRGLHASFPILCGVFQKVRTNPGRRNIDRYPYPHQEGENPDDMPNIPLPQDDTSPDFDIEPTGPITNYGDN